MIFGRNAVCSSDEISELLEASCFCGSAARVYWLFYFRGDHQMQNFYSTRRRLYVYRDLL